MANSAYLKRSQPVANEEFNVHTLRYGNGNGGGDDMQSRVARLESDVEYIKRDITEIKSDIKSIDSRLSEIENGVKSMKTTFKASSAILSVVFAFCVYVFGNYASKILDALNGLVLK
ncbi:TPA: hemolysin XhlA [Enterobacter roggenkampii]|uniref:hemolysin XhlA n=1 Tax=Enterobacter sp. FUJ80071 TaxID=3024862 RepID=UPI0031601D90